MNQAIKELRAAKVMFFHRAGEIVMPVVDEVATFKGRRTRVVRLKPVGVDLMRYELSQVVNWVKFDGRSKTQIPCDPPLETAKAILACAEQFPRLAGVITTPTLRPDGSLLSSEGYDEATGLLLFDPPLLPEIPENPTREDALEQLKLLEELLDEFPFVDAAAQSVAVSGLMTAVLRGAMQVAPLHAATAPTPGSGKSYWIDLAAVIATNEVAPVMAIGRTEEETEKRLAADLLGAQAIISLDNVNGDLGGDFLCQCIERPRIKLRILGRSENREIENRVSLFANGNNIKLVGDINRRVILCSMDASQSDKLTIVEKERPELRKFLRNPVDMVRADRGKYIAAPIIITRAYRAANDPADCKPLASFGD